MSELSPGERVNRWIGQGLGVLAASWMLSGDAAALPPAGFFVDCKRHPAGSVSTTIDTFRQDAVLIGDAATAPDGMPIRWRHDVEVIALGMGEFAVTADGFGPVVTYNLVAKSPTPTTIIWSDTGSVVSAQVPHAEAPPSQAPVVVTYRCHG